MKNETENKNVNENAQPQGLAVRQPQAQTVMATNEPFNIEQAHLSSEFEKSLMQLSVAEITSPTSLLPTDECLATSAIFDMLDCFPFEITDNGQPKEILIYLCEFADGSIKTVGQGFAGSRTKYLTAFDNARLNKKSLRLTNVRFVRLATGKKSGNYPIVIEYTKDSKPIITEKV